MNSWNPCLTASCTLIYIVSTKYKVKIDMDNIDGLRIILLQYISFCWYALNIIFKIPRSWVFMTTYFFIRNFLKVIHEWSTFPIGCFPANVHICLLRQWCRLKSHKHTVLRHKKVWYSFIIQNNLTRKTKTMNEG